MYHYKRYLEPPTTIFIGPSLKPSGYGWSPTRLSHAQPWGISGVAGTPVGAKG